MLEWIWDDEIWWSNGLTLDSVGNISWKDLENQPGAQGYYPDVKDLHWALPLGVCLIVVRLLLERLVIVPVALYCGVTDKPRYKLQENYILEREYKQNKKINYSKIKNISKQTDMTCREIEIWFRRRKQMEVPSKLLKVTDCGWHFTFYMFAFIYGLTILWEKPWLWETKYCWIGFPRQYVDINVYWYYMIELAFYWSLLFTVFTDHKRKDFKEMMIHHFATILLLYFSWMCNFVRMGSLVLVLHDAADPWLALAKMCKYANCSRVTGLIYSIFILVWTISRVFLYPYYILYSTTVEPYHYLIKETFFTHWFLNVLLYTLMVLHLLWSYTIYRVMFEKLSNGKLEDVRSGTDEEVEINNSHQKNNSVIK